MVPYCLYLEALHKDMLGKGCVGKLCCEMCVSFTLVVRLFRGKCDKSPVSEFPHDLK